MTLSVEGRWQAAQRWPRERHWLVWPLAAVATLLAIAAVLLPAQVAKRPELVPMGADLGTWLLGLVAALALAMALAAWWGYRGRIAGMVTAMATGMGALAIAAVLAILPRFDVIKSARGLSKVLLEQSRPGEPYAIWPRLDATFLFHTERFSTNLEGEEELRAFVARPERVWLLAQRDDLGKVAGLPPLREVARDADVGEGYLLLTNRER